MYCEILSDGTVEVNSSLSDTTKSGATVTSDNVITALKKADEI